MNNIIVGMGEALWDVVLRQTLPIMYHSLVLTVAW